MVDRAVTVFVGLTFTVGAASYEAEHETSKTLGTLMSVAICQCRRQ